MVQPREVEHWEATDDGEEEEIERIRSQVNRSRLFASCVDAMADKSKRAPTFQKSIAGEEARDARLRRYWVALAERDENAKSVFGEKPEGLDLSVLYKPGCQREVQDRSYDILFPSVRKLVALFKKRKHLAKTGELKIRCAVCREVKMVRGWDPLLMHAKKYRKSYPNQHRGYYRALKDAFRAENFWPEPADPIIWPPVLLVDNVERSGIQFEGGLRRWRGLNGEEAVPRSLSDLQLQHILAVYRKNGGRCQSSRGVLVFPVSQIGRVDARRINEVLETAGSDGSMNLRLSNGQILPRMRSSNSAGASPPADKPTEKSDSESESECESECESDCNEDHRPLAIQTSVKQIKDTERAVKVMNKWCGSFKEQHCSLPAQPRPLLKSSHLRKMDAKFREDLKNLGPESALAGDECQLQMTERRLRKEKLQWLKDIRQVKEHFEMAERGVKITEAQRDLERQLQMIRKKNDKIAESCKLERDELENHRKHLKHMEYKKMKQHMREIHKRCEGLVNEWEYEQQAFRRQAEIAKLEKDILSSRYKDDREEALVLEQIYGRIKSESENLSDIICNSPKQKDGVTSGEYTTEKSKKAQNGNLIT